MYRIESRRNSLEEALENQNSEPVDRIPDTPRRLKSQEKAIPPSKKLYFRPDHEKMQIEVD